MNLPALTDTLATTPATDSQQPYCTPHRNAQGRFFSPWRPEITKKGPRDILKWRASKNPYQERKRAPLTHGSVSDPLAMLEARRQEATILWLGHASFLVELDGRRLLIDPVFGDINLLVRRQGPQVLDPHRLPRLDAVLLTHGHYDHLDRSSLDVVARSHPECLFVTPLGQGRYLPSSCKERVLEVDWWQQLTLEPITLTFLPSQHWHQRGLRDYNTALWGGWWLQGSHTIYHMGDSGMFGGFETIRAHGRAGRDDAAARRL